MKCSQNQNRTAPYYEVADGPTTEVRNVIQHGLWKLRASTGVGLAIPTRDAGKHRHRGNRIVPRGSMCLIGFKVMRPKHARRGIATTVGHPSMRRLVKADRKQKHDQLETNVYMLQGHASLVDTTMQSANPAQPGVAAEAQQLSPLLFHGLAQFLSANGFLPSLVWAGIPAATVNGSIFLDATPLSPTCRVLQPLRRSERLRE